MYKYGFISIVTISIILTGCIKEPGCPLIKKINFCTSNGWCQILLDNGNIDQTKMPIEGMPFCGTNN